MKELPFLANERTVRAILDGTQTQDRRPLKVQPLGKITSAVLWKDGLWRIEHEPVEANVVGGEFVAVRIRPPWQPGDRLYVRETHNWITLSEQEYTGAKDQYRHPDGYPVHMLYRANAIAGDWDFSVPRWHPNIHMPKWAARIWLEVVNMHIERVQDISQADAHAEGIGNLSYDDPISGSCLAGIAGGCDACANCDPIWHFRGLWNEMYKTKGYGWDVNPCVWVTEFRKIKPTLDSD